jgi:hypothetical protein
MLAGGGRQQQQQQQQSEDWHWQVENREGEEAQGGRRARPTSGEHLDIRHSLPHTSCCPRTHAPLRFSGPRALTADKLPHFHRHQIWTQDSHNPPSACPILVRRPLSSSSTTNPTRHISHILLSYNHVD